MERDDDLLTLEEAMTEFGLSRSTLYRAAKARQIRLEKFPRGEHRVFVRRGEVRRLVAPRAPKKKGRK